MLSELNWPLLEQRRAEARLGLFYRIVHNSVDIDAATLMTRSTRPTRKANEVQHTRHMTSKDCYKFSFIPRTIIQWNGIAATGDFNQYKSNLKSHDPYSKQAFISLLSAQAARMLLKERCSLLLQIQMANVYNSNYDHALEYYIAALFGIHTKNVIRTKLKKFIAEELDLFRTILGVRQVSQKCYTI